MLRCLSPLLLHSMCKRCSTCSGPQSATRPVRTSVTALQYLLRTSVCNKACQDISHSTAVLAQDLSLQPCLSGHQSQHCSTCSGPQSATRPVRTSVTALQYWLRTSVCNKTCQDISHSTAVLAQDLSLQQDLSGHQSRHQIHNLMYGHACAMTRQS